MKTTMYSWDALVTLVSGHRLFKERSSGRIAIADESGVTNDGVLWVDDTKSAKVLHTTAQVPVLTDAPSAHYVVVEWEDLVAIRCYVPTLAVEVSAAAVAQKAALDVLIRVQDEASH